MLLAGLALLMTSGTVGAEGETIQVLSSSAVSEFPEGIRFRLEASSDSEIGSIAVRFKAGQQTYGAYDYLEFESGELVDGELFWRTNTGSRYIPPGTILRYTFEIENAAGDLLATEPRELIFHDARFEWTEVSDGPISVAYHGPVRTRAETILQTIVDTLATMGPILGAETETPIRVTMYNNVKEMLEALPPRSAAVGRELITEGQAFSQFGMLLVLGGSRLSTGTASHEVTHILNDRAARSVFRGLPSWLNEGLAEYGNVDPGFSYDIALEFAIANDRLLPAVLMQVLPGKPEDAIIFYGQSRSIVRFMIEQFGPKTMREFLALLRSGMNMDAAMLATYGADRLGIDALWRKSVDAPPYEPPQTGAARPTPIAYPTLRPYSLTPQAEGSSIESTGEISTPEPASTSTPEPVPTLTPTPAPIAAVVERDDTPKPPAEAAPEEEPGPAPSSGCSAPTNGGYRVADMSSFALLLGLLGLAFRRRLGL